MELNQEETPVSKIPVAGPFWYKLVSRQQSRQQKDMEIIRIKKKVLLHATQQSTWHDVNI